MTTDRTATPALTDAEVAEFEQQGILVPPRNETALADALCRLLQDADLRAVMGERGVQTAAEYSWQHVAEQVLDFYVRTGNRSFPEYAPADVPVTSAVM